MQKVAALVRRLRAMVTLKGFFRFVVVAVACGAVATDAVRDLLAGTFDTQQFAMGLGALVGALSGLW